MPNWWLPWAERIARVLAEAWLRSQPSRGPDPAVPADPAANPEPGTPAQSAAPPVGDTAPPGGLP
jgi:hypothetical protein